MGPSKGFVAAFAACLLLPFGMTAYAEQAGQGDQDRRERRVPAAGGRVTDATPLVLSVSLPGSIGVGEKALRSDIEKQLSQAGVALSDPKKIDAARPYTLLSVRVVALDTLHLPPDLRHYGVTVQEVGVTPPAAPSGGAERRGDGPKEDATKALPRLLRYETQGTASLQSLHGAVPQQVRRLVAEFAIAYKLRAQTPQAPPS